MTYNMVESTARSIVEAVFERMRNRRVSFDAARRELKLLALNHARKRTADYLVDAMLSSISDEIFDASINYRGLFAGNVDARELKELAKKLGYAFTKPPKGDALLTVKNHRNDLAHGVKAFSELGKEVTIADLRSHVAESIRYMRAVIASVETYLDEARYLAANV